MTIRIAGQGESCVLVLGTTGTAKWFGEVVRKEENRVELLFPDGLTCNCELDPAWAAVLVTKVIKADGSWMYFAPSPGGPTKENKTGVDWYARELEYAA